jgi:phosphatidylinositol alpha 1,6-mannosyltransferase
VTSQRSWRDTLALVRRCRELTGVTRQALLRLVRHPSDSSGMPRLLVCTDTWPPQVNGVSVVTALTVEGLAARGWACAVVAPRYPAHLPPVFGTALGEVAPVTAIPSIPTPGYPDIRLARPGDGRVARAIEHFRPDIVHCATEFAIGWTGLKTAHRLRIPVTTSYHTDFGRYTDAYGVPWLRRTVDRHLARFHRAALRTFTPSEVARAELARLGVSHGVTWGCGVDVSHFHRRKRSELLRDAYAQPGACLFLHVGRLAAEKGVERIVRAFHLARRELPEGAAHLIVAGSGPRERAARAEGTEHVTFLGALDRHEVLPRLYASADAFVFASLTETLGLVILEAMASGLPVIATPAGGVAEHLVDGVNGLAYPAADIPALAAQMVRVASDHVLRQRLAVGARATAQRLTWDRELDRLDGMYRELLGASAVRP